MKVFNRMKKAVHGTAFKKSSYMSALTVVVLAIVVAINILAGNLPNSAMELDVSEKKMFRIGDTTKKVLDDLTEDVEILVINQESEVDSRIVRFIDLYQDYSKKVTVKYLDPTLYPSVLTTYNTSSNHVIVRCEATGRSKDIAITDIIEYDEYYYYYYGSYQETAFDGEGEITTAIDYVVSENSETIYELTGHGESSLNDSMLELIGRSNINVSSWSLKMDGTELPEDCATLLINQPSGDLEDGELESLLAYQAGGGNIIIILGTSQNETPNLDALMATYGISTTRGYVGDQRRYYQYSQSVFAFFPSYSSGSITSGLNSDRNLTLVVNPMDLEIEELENVTVDAFLTTSDAGVYMPAESEDYETGKYIIAACAEKTEDEEGAVVSSLTVYGATSIIGDSFMDSSLSNADVFINSVTQYYEQVENISIDAISLETNYNTMTNYGFILVALVIFMVGMIVAGIVIWNYRRKL